jgi:hypothetical protein
MEFAATVTLLLASSGLAAVEMPLGGPANSATSPSGIVRQAAVHDRSRSVGLDVNFPNTPRQGTQ